MAAPLAHMPTWNEIQADLNYPIISQISDLVGSGTKTAGAKRFFGWVARSGTEDAEWMKAYLADVNRDATDLATVRRVHRCIASWTTALLELQVWKSTSVRGQRDHLLLAIDRLREVDEDSFPLIDPKLIPLGAHRDSKGRTSLGELDWKEFTDVEPSRRDATALAIVRAAALDMFLRYEKIFIFGQKVLHEKRSSTVGSTWHEVRNLIEDEITSWETRGSSQFSQQWGEAKSSIIASLANPNSWRELGLTIEFEGHNMQAQLVADLILACVGPTFRLNQAIQTIFCCDTGWNRQPIQQLPREPFAYRTDKKIFLGSERVLAALKTRAGHAVFADPSNAEIVRGIAEANFNSEWDDLAANLRLDKGDEQCRLELDGELLDLLRRYQNIQAHSRSWVDETTRPLFFHALSQRAIGVQVADRDINLTMPADSPLKRAGVNFSAVRKAFLNSLSSAGLEPSFISEIAGHRSANILQKNYIIGAQATRTYEDPARFWQSCVQEIAMNDKIAFKLSIPDVNREWFRTLGLLTGITAACGMEPLELDGVTTEDYIFVPSEANFIGLFLAHRGIIKQRPEVSYHRWMVQGEALLKLIKGYGRKISEKNLGREYRAAARIANSKLKTGELSVPLMLEI